MLDEAATFGKGPDFKPNEAERFKTLVDAIAALNDPSFERTVSATLYAMLAAGFLSGRLRDATTQSVDSAYKGEVVDLLYQLPDLNDADRKPVVAIASALNYLKEGRLDMIQGALDKAR